MLAHRLAVMLMLALATAAGAEDRPAPPPVDHVIIISVDGLRSDALLAMPRTGTPSLRRLLSGASTLNARTIETATVTLPNHASMLTGRPARGPGAHGVVLNEYEPGAALMHDGPSGYVAGVFDVAHDHGLYTTLLAGKDKFAVFDDAWNGTNGAEDRTAPDHGPDKIDRCVLDRDATVLTDAALETLDADHQRTLQFLHFADPDWAGHSDGWDLTVGSKFLNAVATVDRQLERILRRVTEREKLRGRVAIILTADHGGGAPHLSHVRVHMWVNYIIPFMVWTGDDAGPADLYELNTPGRADPGLKQPRTGADRPPVRNGDAANVALHLLGLPPVPGSTFNKDQDLVVRP